MENMLLIQGKNEKTDLSEAFALRLLQAAEAVGSALDTIEIPPDGIAPCTGCLRCWASEFGVCVRRDLIVELKSRIAASGLAVFLAPARYGQLSSLMKNAIDRGAFAQVGVHEETPPAIAVVGYGADLDDEEKSTFEDIVNKHMGKADAIHPELRNIPIEAFAVRSEADCEAVCSAIFKRIPAGEGGARR